MRDNEYGMLINMVSRKIKKRMNSTLSDIGITGVQGRMIHYIVDHYTDEPVFQRDIESKFELSRSTVTCVLQLLEKNGYILRENVSYDGRLKKLIPTEKSLLAAEKMGECVAETELVMTKDLSPGQLQLFMEIISKMYRNLDEK